MTNVIKTTNPLVTMAPSVTTIMLKIQFPPPCTRATRTFDIDWNLTVDEGIKVVASQMRDTELAFKYGKLLVPNSEKPLDGNTKLKEYASLLASVDHVAFVPYEKDLTYTVLGGFLAALTLSAVIIYYKRRTTA
eukprot:TRINITY_DN272_c0_g1_i2.p1 TRINITY_DN272_c0_g1~~TRINITY_DN272_c0_g1_i2.p1  ORF type:complete len:134 (-),score=37.27 TRINITY_DN272_c0_g1_i2:72-473(-)